MISTTHLALLTALALIAPLAAQNLTTHSLTVGGAGALGCQGPEDPPTLSNGTLASAQLDLTYEQATHQLTLVVTNTSLVVAGEPNPVVTDVGLNVPPGTITSATLLSQNAASGATPSFALAFDPDPTAKPSSKYSCLGNFSIDLASASGGIGNASATTFAVPAGALSIGPATLVLRLDGPGADFLTAYIIAVGFSQRAPLAPANGVCKFQAGGSSGEGSGFLSTTSPAVVGCQQSVFIGASPTIGTTVNFCVSAAPACTGCWIGSLFPGPVQVGPINLPIGVPLLFEVMLQLPVSANVCFPLAIPSNQNLVGVTVYLTFATLNTAAPPPSGLGLLNFSPRFDVTFTAQ